MVWLGVPANPLVVIREHAGARQGPATAGLFHVALRVPDRPALASFVRHLLGSGWSPEGFADHLVSEAVYLRNPEGNGIEVYRGRLQERWFECGALRMDTLPLDLRGLLTEAPRADPGARPQLPSATVSASS